MASGNWRTMFSLDDLRWTELKGGYHTPFDPRPALAQLETGSDVDNAWYALWEELHHQGDVGEASYAAVPHLVRIHQQRGVVDWNTYAIVATIELARDHAGNPPMPKWLEKDYAQALHNLAAVGTTEILRTDDLENVRAILSIIALAKGARMHAKFLINYSDEEMLEFESEPME
jgi:hypothetical protein